MYFFSPSNSPLMLLWTLIVRSKLRKQIHYFFNSLFPRDYPLTPFTPVQPNFPSEVVT